MQNLAICSEMFSNIIQNIQNFFTKLFIFLKNYISKFQISNIYIYVLKMFYNIANDLIFDYIARYLFVKSAISTCILYYNLRLYIVTLRKSLLLSPPSYPSLSPPVSTYPYTTPLSLSFSPTLHLSTSISISNVIDMPL